MTDRESKAIITTYRKERYYYNEMLEDYYKAERKNDRIEAKLLVDMLWKQYHIVKGITLVLDALGIAHTNLNLVEDFTSRKDY